MMNQIQKEKDPEAYKPEIEKTVIQREAQMKKIKLMEEERKKHIELMMKEKEDHERALFDFDQDIDELEKVEERYPAPLKPIN